MVRQMTSKSIVLNGIFTGASLNLSRQNMFMLKPVKIRNKKKPMSGIASVICQFYFNCKKTYRNKIAADQ